jgi:molybdate transport system ATP-binding protein
MPVIYVTHDMGEVERLADRLVLLERGRVIGAGDVHAMLATGDFPLSRRSGAAAVLEGTVQGVDRDYGLARVAVAGAEILLPAHGTAAGQHRRLRIKADDVSICRVAPENSSILNVLPARILEVLAHEGHRVTLVLGLGGAGDGARLLSRISHKSRDALALAVGDAVFAQVKGVALA